MGNSKILILIAVLASFAGCKKEEPTPDLSRTLEFSSLTGERVYILEDTAPIFGTDEDVAFRDSASVLMPEVLFGHDISELRDHIQSMAFDTVCSEPSVAMASFFYKAAEELGYQVVENDSVDVSDDSMMGFCNVQGDIYSLTDKRLTYRVALYTYNPGAAHGMYTLNYLTYDLRKGQIITLEDLFTPAGLEKLPAMIARRASRMISQLGPTHIDSLPTDGNFYISLDDEIVFVYQPYEVASYAQGVICVPFYPYDLTEYLTPLALNLFSLTE